jgi:hypothetical protein
LIWYSGGLRDELSNIVLAPKGAVTTKLGGFDETWSAEDFESRTPESAWKRKVKNRLNTTTRVDAGCRSVLSEKAVRAVRASLSGLEPCHIVLPEELKAEGEFCHFYALFLCMFPNCFSFPDTSDSDIGGELSNVKDVIGAEFDNYCRLDNVKNSKLWNLVDDYADAGRHHTLRFFCECAGLKSKIALELGLNMPVFGDRFSPSNEQLFDLAPGSYVANILDIDGTRDHWVAVYVTT